MTPLEKKYTKDSEGNFKSRQPNLNIGHEGHLRLDLYFVEIFGFKKAIK